MAGGPTLPGRTAHLHALTVDDVELVVLGVTLLSFMVWQHHLFVSGMNAGLRPFYMLTTELISIPTGFIFLNAIGTLWRARIRFTVPMLFALAFFFNFLIGGLSGVLLSDVPSDVTTHGSYFVMAHFHYTIVGGLVFAFFGAVYYWLPKMLGAYTHWPRISCMRPSLSWPKPWPPSSGRRLINCRGSHARRRCRAACRRSPPDDFLLRLPRAARSRGAGTIRRRARMACARRRGNREIL